MGGGNAKSKRVSKGAVNGVGDNQAFGRHYLYQTEPLTKAMVSLSHVQTLPHNFRHIIEVSRLTVCLTFRDVWRELGV